MTVCHSRERINGSACGSAGDVKRTRLNANVLIIDEIDQADNSSRPDQGHGAALDHDSPVDHAGIGGRAKVIGQKAGNRAGSIVINRIEVREPLSNVTFSQ